MKNYLVTEDQLKKIVENIDEPNDNDSLGILGKLFGSQEKEDGPEKVDLSQVSSDDPIIKFFDSLK